MLVYHTGYVSTSLHICRQKGRRKGGGGLIAEYIVILFIYLLVHNSNNINVYFGGTNIYARPTPTHHHVRGPSVVAPNDLHINTYACI